MERNLKNLKDFYCNKNEKIIQEKEIIDEDKNLETAKKEALEILEKKNKD